MSDFSISGCGKGHVPDKEAQYAKKVNQNQEAKEINQGSAEAHEIGPHLCDMSKINPSDRFKIAIEKIGKIDPEKFKDIFGDSQVSHAKDEIKEMVNLSGKDKGKLADLVREFDKTTSKMDNGQLLEVAQHLNDLMRKTDGNDDLLGSLLGDVLDKMDKPAKGKPPFPFPPGPIWNEKLPEEKHFPWDEKFPDFHKMNDPNILIADKDIF